MIQEIYASAPKRETNLTQSFRIINNLAFLDSPNDDMMQASGNVLLDEA